MHIHLWHDNNPGPNHIVSGVDVEREQAHRRSGTLLQSYNLLPGREVGSITHPGLWGWPFSFSGKSILLSAAGGP